MCSRLAYRIDCLHRLGECLRGESPDPLLQASFDAGLKEAVRAAVSENEWFTEYSIRYALDAIGHKMLQRSKLEDWLDRYPTKTLSRVPKSGFAVGVIAAGNLPLVGFFDVLCVLILGIPLRLKVSRKDARLMPFILQFLLRHWSEAQWDIAYSSSLDLGSIHALLGTGSDENTQKMAQNWAQIPCLLRNSRATAGWLTGRETDRELDGLVRDVCLYYGMGCRNIHTLFWPRDYSPNRLIEAFKRAQEDPLLGLQQAHYRQIIQIARAQNRLLERPFLDAGSVLFVPSDAFFAPVGTVYTVVYSDEKDLWRRLTEKQDRLQALVCSSPEQVPFGFRTAVWGEVQRPELEDAPDGLDPVDFLLRLA